MKTMFHEIITTEDELRAIVGHPGELVRNKVISYLDPHCRHFIAASPFLVMATSHKDGCCDASPRGDAPGFVRVIDDQHLVIPERPGNRRLDSMRNILANPNVGLIFMIPDLEETLRVNGKAFITTDKELLQGMVVNDRVPVLGIGVRVEECYIHCAKAFKRSGLWDPSSWLPQNRLPSAAQILADHVELPEYTVGKIVEALNESYTKRLY
jgi:PPOX class probable FMN-dependent enzyme